MPKKNRKRKEKKGLARPTVLRIKPKPEKPEEISEERAEQLKQIAELKKEQAQQKRLRKAARKQELAAKQQKSPISVTNETGGDRE